MTSASESCAVIGAGNLGAAVAERLLAEGHDITLCDREAAKLRRFEAMGATTTASAADCVAREQVLVLVATEAQLRAVAANLARSAGERRDAPFRRLAVMSTVPAQAVRDVAAMLEPVGVAVVDAPVSGGAARARAGMLTVMAGGSEEDLAALSPLLASLASNVFHCGALGAGQMTKIVNNILCHANTALTAEAFRLGMAQGLRPAAMARAMEVSTGRNWLTATPTLAAETFAHHTSDRGVYDAILSILQKDMVIAADLTGEQEAAFPMIEGLAALIAAVGDETYETWRKVAADLDDRH